MKTQTHKQMKPLSFKETSEQYAIRRTLETGKPYAVWSNDDGSLQWSARFCCENDRVYWSTGATKRRVFTVKQANRINNKNERALIRRITAS